MTSLHQAALKRKTAEFKLFRAFIPLREVDTSMIVQLCNFFFNTMKRRKKLLTNIICDIEMPHRKYEVRILFDTVKLADP